MEARSDDDDDDILFNSKLTPVTLSMRKGRNSFLNKEKFWKTPKIKMCVRNQTDSRIKIIKTKDK